MKSLLILGAGGHGKVVQEVAHDFLGYEMIDFLDDNAKNAIGKIEDFGKFRSTYKNAFVALGNNALREGLIMKLKANNFIVVNIIHPSAIISSSTKLGTGIYIGAGAILNSNTTVCDGTIIGIGARMDHDSVASKFSYIKTGAVLMDGSTIGEKGTIKEGSFFYK